MANHVDGVPGLTRLDLDFTPTNVGTADPYREKNSTFSNEIQLLSNASSPIQWIAGLYFFYGTPSDPGLRLNIPALGAARYQEIDGEMKTWSYAVFGQVVVPLFDERTKLTLGGRYTIDKRHATGTISTALGTVLAVDAEKTWKKPTFRAVLSHDFSDNVMAYASFNTGFKSGVFNLLPISSAPINPETIKAYEVGVKSDLLDRRVRLNLSSFYYDYKNIQLSRFVGGSTILQNAAAAEIYGVEGELTAELSRTLSLTAGAAWLHARYSRFPNAVAFPVNPLTGLGQQTVIDATGHDLPRAPDFSGNVGLAYKQPVGSGMIGANAMLQYTGSFKWEPDNIYVQKDYAIVNGELSWTGPEDRYKIRAWAKNLFNKQYFGVVLGANNQPPAAAPGEPRTYGLAFEYKF